MDTSRLYKSDSALNYSKPASQDSKVFQQAQQQAKYMGRSVSHTNLTHSMSVDSDILSKIPSGFRGNIKEKETQGLSNNQSLTETELDGFRFTSKAEGKDEWYLGRFHEIDGVFLGLRGLTSECLKKAKTPKQKKLLKKLKGMSEKYKKNLKSSVVFFNNALSKRLGGLSKEGEVFQNQAALKMSVQALHFFMKNPCFIKEGDFIDYSIMINSLERVYLCLMCGGYIENAALSLTYLSNFLLEHNLGQGISVSCPRALFFFGMPHALFKNLVVDKKEIHITSAFDIEKAYSILFNNRLHTPDSYREGDILSKEEVDSRNRQSKIMKLIVGWVLLGDYQKAGRAIEYLKTHNQEPRYIGCMLLFLIYDLIKKESFSEVSQYIEKLPIPDFYFQKKIMKGFLLYNMAIKSENKVELLNQAEGVFHDLFSRGAPVFSLYEDVLYEQKKQKQKGKDEKLLKVYQQASIYYADQYQFYKAEIYQIMADDLQEKLHEKKLKKATGRFRQQLPHSREEGVVPEALLEKSSGIMEHSGDVSQPSTSKKTDTTVRKKEWAGATVTKLSARRKKEASSYETPAKALEQLQDMLKQDDHYSRIKDKIEEAIKHHPYDLKILQFATYCCQYDESDDVPAGYFFTGVCKLLATLMEVPPAEKRLQKMKDSHLVNYFDELINKAVERGGVEKNKAQWRLLSSFLASYAYTLVKKGKTGRENANQLRNIADRLRPEYVAYRLSQKSQNYPKVGMISRRAFDNYMECMKYDKSTSSSGLS